MLAAIVFSHVAFGAVEFVIRTAYKTGWLGVTGGIAMGRGGAIGQRNGYHTGAASFLFQFA